VVQVRPLHHRAVLAQVQADVPCSSPTFGKVHHGVRILEHLAGGIASRPGQSDAPAVTGRAVPPNSKWMDHASVMRCATVAAWEAPSDSSHRITNSPRTAHQLAGAGPRPVGPGPPVG
jgi:hypothetical protein